MFGEFSIGDGFLFRALGLDKSLFERLDGQNATSELSLQYRMNRFTMSDCFSKLYLSFEF